MQKHVAILLASLEEIHRLSLCRVFHVDEGLELSGELSADLNVVNYVVNKVFLIKKCDIVQARVAVHIARFDEVLGTVFCR